MINKILFPLDFANKVKLFSIIFFLFFATILEILGIGLIPIFLTAILLPEKIPSYFYNIEYFKIFLNLSADTIILYGSVILLIIFIFKNFYLTIILIFEKKFLKNINVTNATNLFRHFIYSNYQFHLQRNASELYSIIIHANNQYVEYLRCFILFIKESLLVLLIFLMLIYYQPEISIIVFSFLLLFVFSYFLIFRKILFNKGLIKQEYLNSQSKTMYESFGSIKETKILNKENYFIKAFKSQTEIAQKQDMFLQIIQHLPRLIIETLIVASLVIIILFFYYNDISIENFIPIISLFTISAVRLMPAFTSLAFSTSSLKFLTNSLNIINKEIQKIANSYYLNLEQGFKHEFKESIVFNNITFKYPNTKSNSVSNISFSINTSEIVGVIGKSGSGKSTIIDLILGLHENYLGEILIDNNNLNRNKKSWHSLIGYVPQSIYLIDDSILSNIAFGIEKNKINHEKINEVIKLAQLENFIKNLPNGLNTNVGENGVKVSAGQKQRIGIARALYSNPKIIILDEATSSLDHLTEKDFIESIVKINNEKKLTIILIAHKLNTIKICDSLLLIKDGILLDQDKYKNIFSRHEYLRDYYNNT